MIDTQKYFSTIIFKVGETDVWSESLMGAGNLSVKVLCLFSLYNVHSQFETSDGLLFWNCDICTWFLTAIVRAMMEGEIKGGRVWGLFFRTGMMVAWLVWRGNSWYLFTLPSRRGDNEAFKFYHYLWQFRRRQKMWKVNPGLGFLWGFCFMLASFNGTAT